MQKIKQPIKFEWQRDVRMVIRPGIYCVPAKEEAQDNDIYVLSRFSPTCAIVPRGIFRFDQESYARYVYYLEGFIEERCAENMTIYLVILRGAYDILTAETILRAQKKCKQIRLICIEVSDSYFLKLKPSLRKRYMSILQQANELHQYDQDLELGDAEVFALIHADRIMFIISEKMIDMWQEIIDMIRDVFHNPGEQLYNISQCWVIYMEWIMHQEVNDLIL